MDDSGVKEDGGEESVELVRPFRMQERYHSADVVQTFHLRAKRRLLVKVTVDEVAVLLRGDPTHSVNPDATRMTDYLANHMLRHLILVTADGKVAVAPLTSVFAETVIEGIGFSTDRPLGNIVRPFIRRDACRGVAELWI